MALVVDSQHTGTDERTWLAWEGLRELAPFSLLDLQGHPRPRRLVVVAPHPDDEVFGAGGLMQQTLRAGLEVTIVAVTDGEASHPLAHARGLDLAAVRRAEVRIALERLGCRRGNGPRIGLADGRVAEEADGLVDALVSLFRPGDICVAPWRRDGHPDHDASGAAALAAARVTGTPAIEYMVWAWHWALPATSEVPWENCRRLDLTRREVARKRWATCAFTSQIRPLGSEFGAQPLLPASVLRRFWRPFEVFIEGAS